MKTEEHRRHHELRAAFNTFRYELERKGYDGKQINAMAHEFFDPKKGQPVSLKQIFRDIVFPKKGKL